MYERREGQQPRRVLSRRHATELRHPLLEIGGQLLDVLRRPTHSGSCTSAPVSRPRPGSARPLPSRPPAAPCTVTSHYSVELVQLLEDAIHLGRAHPCAPDAGSAAPRDPAPSRQPGPAALSRSFRRARDRLRRLLHRLAPGAPAAPRDSPPSCAPDLGPEARADLRDDRGVQVVDFPSVSVRSGAW